MQELESASYQYSFHEECQSLRGMSPLSPQKLIEYYGIENVVQVTLINSSLHQALTKALEKMIENKLQIEKQLKYASYGGKIYKCYPKVKYTYSCKCEARPFINTLATNEHFKSMLIRGSKR